MGITLVIFSSNYTSEIHKQTQTYSGIVGMRWHLGRCLHERGWSIWVLSWASWRSQDVRDFRLTRHLWVQAVACSLQMPFGSSSICVLLKHPLPHAQQPFSMFSLSVRSGCDTLKNGDIFCEVWRFLSPSGASAAQLPSSLAIQRLERSNAFVLLSVHLSKERLAVRLFLWGWESMQNSPVSCRAVRT